MLATKTAGTGKTLARDAIEEDEFTEEPLLNGRLLPVAGTPSGMPRKVWTDFKSVLPDLDSMPLQTADQTPRR